MSFIKSVCGGRLVRDPEVRYSEKGMAVCKFCLAVDRPKKQGQDKAESDFFNFSAFGKLGELIGNNFSKGNYLLVTECRPQTYTYTDKTGNSKSSIDFIVNGIDFTERKGGGGNSHKDVPFNSRGSSTSFDPNEIMF